MRRLDGRKLLSVLFMSVMLYGGFGFLHVEYTITICPQCQTLPLSFYMMWLPTNLFGLVSFLGSWLGFVGWRYFR